VNKFFGNINTTLWRSSFFNPYYMTIFILDIMKLYCIIETNLTRTTTYLQIITTFLHFQVIEIMSFISCISHAWTPIELTSKDIQIGSNSTHIITRMQISYSIGHNTYYTSNTRINTSSLGF
jgi:hypothetical protein